MPVAFALHTLASNNTIDIIWTSSMQEDDSIWVAGICRLQFSGFPAYTCTLKMGVDLLLCMHMILLEG